jgi:ElaB/YqjD/DUF883 family membrane-anchored ribosome-binding protein
MSALEGTPMIPQKPIEQVTALTEQAARSAEEAIKSTQRAADEALQSLAHTMENIRHQTAPWLKHANNEMGSLAQRGMASVQETSKLVQDQALKARQSAEHYITNDPVKALLIAAASGAALMALISLASRSSCATK